MLTAASARLGAILQPLELVRQSLRDGVLQEVLPACRPVRPPISVLYARDRRVTPKLKSFLDFCVAEFTESSLTER